MERDEFDKNRLTRLIVSLIQKFSDLQKLIDDPDRRIKALGG
jgi:hypothetical protein